MPPGDSPFAVKYTFIIIIIIRKTIKETEPGGGYGLIPSGSGQRPVGGFYEHGTETSDIKKYWKFQDVVTAERLRLRSSDLWHHTVVTDVVEEPATTCHLPIRLYSVIIKKAAAYFISAMCFHILFQNHPHRPWIPRSLVVLGKRGSFPGVKRSGREVDHSPPSNAEVKNQ